jgi:hypothetical protein
VQGRENIMPGFEGRLLKKARAFKIFEHSCVQNSVEQRLIWQWRAGKTEVWWVSGMIYN